ncbi:MAG: hypothetical protein WCQ41_05470 [Bacillota bacterium]
MDTQINGQKAFDWKQFFMGMAILLLPSIIYFTLVFLANIREMYGLITIFLVVVYSPIPTIIGLILWIVYKKTKHSLALGFLVGGLVPMLIMAIGSFVLLGSCGLAIITPH